MASANQDPTPPAIYAAIRAPSVPNGGQGPSPQPPKQPTTTSRFGTGFRYNVSMDVTNEASGRKEGGMSDELVKDLAARVKTLESDVGIVKTDVATIKTTLLHMPTKLWIAGWGLVGLGGVVLILWRVIAVLLESMGAQLAAEVAKAVAK